MPRRVWTYTPSLGWDLPNLVSTVGAYVIAAGVFVVLLDFALNFRPGVNAGENIYRAGTLEWLPSGSYQTRSIPVITSREPLWDQPGLAAAVEQGRFYLPGTVTGARETIVTSPVDAVPQYVLRIPGPSWLPFVAAIATAAFFIGLTVKLYLFALVCGVLAVAFVIAWLWGSDPVLPVTSKSGVASCSPPMSRVPSVTRGGR